MTRKAFKYLTSIGVILLLTTTTVTGKPVEADAGQVIRISGSDRYATAAQVAVSNWTTSHNVVLVSGEGYADAVSASTLAKKLEAPILLTTAEELNPNTLAALTLLEAKEVYVVGGNASISQNIRNKLKSKYRLTELGGKNRYETNVAVAKELANLGVDLSNIMMVGGEGFSDALSVAPVASAKEQIILLACNDINYMEPAIDFTKTLGSDITVVGTKSVISDEIRGAFKVKSDIDGGYDRFDTNLKVLSAFSSSLNFNKVYIANASNDQYADALVACAVAGKTGAALVLLDSEKSQATANAIEYLKTNINKTSDLNVIGGTGVVTNDTVDAINMCFTDNPIVTFKDINLDEAVRNCINKPKGTLYKSDIDKISELKVSKQYIHDLSGIENLTSLQKLDLSSNQLNDISELKNLTNLNELNLCFSNIQDVSAIGNLTSLQKLDLSSNIFSDISILNSLTNLEELNLDTNNINDISGLKNLSHLQKLDLSYNQKLGDLSPLKYLVSLKELNLNADKISNISALGTLTNLEYLSLTDNSIKDINGLKNLTHLQKLNLENSRPYDDNDPLGNKISDISGLKDLINLQFLDVSINKINNIDALKNLTSLQELNLNNNEIKDISSLINLTNLQKLDLSCNHKINDIDSLNNLTSLESLGLYGNQINNISALKNLVNLNSLSLDDNKIINIDALENLNKLQYLGLGDNEISDISALKNLTNLNELDLRNTKISDISSLKNLTNLQKLFLNNTKISDEDKASLKNSLTKCSITY